MNATVAVLRAVAILIVMIVCFTVGLLVGILDWMFNGVRDESA